MGILFIAMFFAGLFVFLLFAIPQLVDWARYGSRETRIVAGVALAATLVSQWSLCFERLLRIVPHWRIIHFLIDEAANWILFAALLHLLVHSLPRWVWDDIIRIRVASRG